MNKKANIFLGVVVALLLFISGILLLPFVTDDISTTRVDLDCDNTDISDGTKWTCLMVDLVVPYLIIFFVSLAVGYLVGR